MPNLFISHAQECRWHETSNKPTIPEGHHFCPYCRRHRFLYFKPYEMILIFIGFLLFGLTTLSLNNQYQVYQQELYQQTSVALSTIVPMTLTAESFTDTPQPTATHTPQPTLTYTAHPVLLTRGIGLTNRSIMYNGEFQVEGYCNIIGGTVSRTDDHWYCGNYQLRQSDYDMICRETYNRDDAFALQNGSGQIPAFRWRCYEFS